MASLRMLGHWLDGSGWVQCLVTASVAISGVAESFINASHVKRTHCAHTVTAASLFILLNCCYSQYCEGLSDKEILSFELWHSHRAKTSTQFQYWNTVLELELLVLMFVQSIREGNFELYVDSVSNIAPWFFALDHTNYARWMTVNLRDMQNLKETHPDIASQFSASYFTNSRPLELLPSTCDFFLQHVERAMFQAIHCWGHCLEQEPMLPNPLD